MTVTIAALCLGVSRSTIWRMIKDGTLPTVRVRNRSVRVPVSAISLLVGKIEPEQQAVTDD